MLIKINGQNFEARPAETILDVARREGIEIPTLCQFDGYDNGVCRLCMVEAGSNGRLVPSCSTKVSEGMAVVTESERIIRYRNTLLKVLMKNHGSHEGRQEEKCSLHAFAEKYGIGKTPEIKIIQEPDKTHPAIQFNPSLCIACRRCVIACNEEQNNDVIALSGKGFKTLVTFDAKEPFGGSSCTTCGSCVDSCPTGALIEKNWEPAERTEISTCPYCAVGCTVEYGIAGNKIIWAKGVKGEGVNDGKLCVKGKFGYEFEMSADRLLKPLIRRENVEKGPLNGRKVNEVFREASWDEALDLVAKKISETRKKYGKKAVAGIASDRATNEDVYALQKLMRAGLGIDNVDQSATLCHSPSAAMLSWALGAGASTNPISDVFNSKTIMVVGSNTDRAHPVLSSYIKKAAETGSHLIVVDPRKVELAGRSHTFLQLKPGTDVFLFSAMAKYIIENNLQDKTYIEANSEGYEEYVKSLEQFDLKTAEKVTGISAKLISEVARRYAADKPSSIFWTLGITEHANGSDNVSSLVNLAILTGNIGIPGGGLNPIRGQNNVQGGADMGGFPGSLPGYQSLVDEGIRKRFEEHWNAKLPEEVGWKSTEMIERALYGDLRLMYITGENSMRSHPNSQEVKEALLSLDFIAVQDLFMTETAEFADVVLPAASTFEKSGTFTNTERRVQRVRPLLSPPGEARSDWEIYSDLARRLGYDLGFKDSEDIMKEVSVLVPAWKGISHSRLESGGLQWPVPTEQSNGTIILHEGKVMRGKARFRPLKWEPYDFGDYPYVLITGRKREHYHTATMTGRSKVISSITEGPFVEMNANDMRNENVIEGEMVEVISTTGSIKARIKSGKELPPGVAFTTFHFGSLPANVLTPTVLDPLTKTPAYKDTRIKIKKIS